MTQDEIIEMAKQSGMEVWKGGHRYMDDFDIYKFAKLVALHEREACALVCESHWEKRVQPVGVLELFEQGAIMTDWGKAPIKMEGGIADPDEFTWECNCEDCKVKYQKWKEAYDIQQKQLRGQS